MKLSDKQANATQRVLVFGAPKVGKTELVGALSTKFNLVWFDLENGYSTLLKLPDEQKARIELISVPDSRTFPVAIDTMLKVFTGKACNVCEAHGKVNCPVCTKAGAPTTRVCLDELDDKSIVVVDSLTQLSNSAIAFITRDKPDDYKMDYSDWGNLRTLVEKFLSTVQQARYNIVCISHEEEVDLEDGTKKLVPVCGSSKSSRNTAKYFDHVIYAVIKNRSHKFASSTTYAGNIVTGSRLDIEIEKSEKPSLLDIFERGTITTRPADQGTKALAGLRQGIKLGGGK